METLPVFFRGGAKKWYYSSIESMGGVGTNLEKSFV
jgi:hypothetical protein